MSFVVHAENFLSFAEFDFDFGNKGLCLISGSNLDKPLYKSNGSGKSSLIDALCWGLYGESIKGKTADDVINKKAGKNCFVQVDWGIYRVIRYRKHTKFKDQVLYFENGKDITAKSNKDVQLQIDKALGLGYESFVHSIYFRQSTLESFASGTDADQKKIIEDILSLYLISDAQKICKDKVTAIQIEIDVLQGKTITLNIKLQEATSRKNMLVDRSSEFEVKKKNSIFLAEKTIHELETQRTKAPSDFNIEAARGLVKQAEPVAQVNVDLEKKAWDIQSEMQKHQKDYSAAENRKSQLEMNLKMKYQKIRSDAENRKTQLEIQLKMNNDRLVEMQNELANLESVYPESRVCPTCGGPMKPEDLGPKIITAKDRLKQLSTNVDGLIKNIQEQDVVLSNTETPEVSTPEIKEQEIILANLGTPADKTAEVEEIRYQIAKNKQIVELCAKMKTRIAEEESRLKVMEQLENRIEDATKNLIKEQEAKNPYLDQLIDEQAGINNTQSQIDETTVKMAERKDEQAYSSYWVDGLSNNKLKSYIMDSITPFLNERANHYSTFLNGGMNIEISTLTKLKSGEWRDKFSVTITDEQGADYNGLSGGEKRRVDLAILLALQDLVASRSSNPINLLIFDEVCENLDSVGIEMVLNLFKDIANNKSSCFYITHDEGMQTLFQNVVNIEKKNGISRILND